MPVTFASTSPHRRRAAVAGRFYPAAPMELAASVDGMLGGCAQTSTGEVPKALIVPHAGYRFSGAIAASAYRTLAGGRDVIRRVVLVGPAHRLRLHDIAAPTAECFATPLGDVAVDVGAVQACVSRFDRVVFDAAAHRDEHALETQLPFLQRCLTEFSVVPLAVGAVSPAQVAECLDYLWGGPETLILISSDLSHFHSDVEARRLDRMTTDAICRLDPSPITYDHACGQVGIRGLLQMARQRKLTVRTLDVGNSGDACGDTDRVVGYGSYAFYPPTEQFGLSRRRALSRAAWTAIDHGLRHGDYQPPCLAGCDPDLLRPGASFVTLKDAEGELRGCIGSLRSKLPLLENVARNAYRAAFRDDRFQPLDVTGRNGLQLDISVLGPLKPLDGKSAQEILVQLQPFVDGLVLESGNHRATFLPAVWWSIPSPAMFLARLRQKACLAQDCWSDAVVIHRYTTETWSTS